MVIGALILGCDEERLTGVERPDRRLVGADGAAAGLTVMTQNVYVGADVDRVLAATSPEQIPILVAEAFQELQSTDFPERAEALAGEIARRRPHVIGLQEISIVRIQSPGDAAIGGTVPAENVLFDYLEILMAALGARGLDYRVAGIVENADVEVPMIVSIDPLAFDDVRLTDFDVVLARGDVAISDVVARNFAQPLPVPGFGIEIPRGFVAVDAKIGGRTYRFVNTHLEPASLEVQLAQARELIELLAASSKPVVLVGDLNTPAPTGATYRLLESAGYVDAWTHNVLPREGEGLTNPHESDLRNDEVAFTQRIDLILVRNPAGKSGQTVLGSVFATVWGDEASERTASGLWPSDHAGVIAHLRAPVLGGTVYAH